MATKKQISNETKLTGNLMIYSGEYYSYPKLKEVTGYIYLSENAKLDAPLLATSGYIDLSENAKLDAPLLATSGNIYLRENAKLDAPLLATSGNIDLSENAKLDSKHLKFIFTQGQFLKFTYKNKKLNACKIDNQIFICESIKTTKGIVIKKGYNYLGIDKGVMLKEDCFIASKEAFNAHGKTIKQAISDLQFKIASEKLKNDPILPTTKITVNHYRLITGACEMGVKSWMKQNGITKEGVLAKELLPILEKTNAYGLSQFKRLYTKN